MDDRGWKLDPTLSKLATGKLELEVKRAGEKERNQPYKLEEKKERNQPYKLEEKKEDFTAWGKELGGLQSGLGFRPGEKRVYHHGETVKLVVRIRNVGKEEVSFEYVSQFLIEIPPAVTDGKGKLVPAGLRTLFVVHLPKQVKLAPGKEIELYGELEVRPDFGTGKISVQYGRVFGNSSSSTITFDPALGKLATGKLELEIKSDPPPATGKEPPRGRDLPAAGLLGDVAGGRGAPVAGNAAVRLPGPRTERDRG